LCLIFCTEHSNLFDNCPASYEFGLCVWTAGQRTDPATQSPFEWKVSLSNGTVIRQSVVVGPNSFPWITNQPSFQSNAGNTPESCMAVCACPKTHGCTSDDVAKCNDVLCTQTLCFLCEIDP